MKQDDLTRLKHVGSFRMKLLNDSGIKTISQLHEIPMEKLSEIRSIGDYYAKLIKNSVSDYYKETNRQLRGKPVTFEKIKNGDLNRDLKKRIKKLRKTLNRVNENLKPLWEKKYLVLYVNFKKRFTKLKARLRKLVRIMDELTDEDKKNIIKKADALIINLKNVGKKPKKKKYNTTIQEIQYFSKFLKNIVF
jgi:DUF438 domain-containing protein